jgi:DNA-binding MarR family transcriptional regulator
MKPTISQKELGYLLDMRNQSLGELLVKLEKKGYIVRIASEEDKRTYTITLTELGRLVQVDAHAGDSMAAIYDIFRDDEKNTLADMMDRLIEEIDRRLADAQPESNVFDRLDDVVHKVGEHVGRLLMRETPPEKESYTDYEPEFDTDPVEEMPPLDSDLPE